MLVVMLTYAVTPVHSDGRNGKDYTLYLLTFFPFVGPFQFRSCSSYGHLITMAPNLYSGCLTLEILPAISCLH